MNKLWILPLVAALGACSTTPRDLESKSAPTIQTYTENYQEIFRRVSTVAKRCYTSNINAYASTAVDAQLYPDLGYGDITVSLVDMGIRNYYLSGKIERDGTGAKMTLRSGNTLAAQRYIDFALRWASGNEDCPAF